MDSGILQKRRQYIPENAMSFAACLHFETHEILLQETYGKSDETSLMPDIQ